MTGKEEKTSFCGQQMLSPPPVVPWADGGREWPAADERKESAGEGHIKGWSEREKRLLMNPTQCSSSFSPSAAPPSVRGRHAK